MDRCATRLRCQRTSRLSRIPPRSTSSPWRGRLIGSAAALLLDDELRLVGLLTHGPEDLGAERAGQDDAARLVPVVGACLALVAPEQGAHLALDELVVLVVRAPCHLDRGAASLC